MATALQEPKTIATDRSIADRLLATLQAQRAAFLSFGPPPLVRRQADLQALKRVLLDSGDRLVDAVNEDFGHRARPETSYDLLQVVEGIEYLLRNLGDWMRPGLRQVQLPFRPGWTWFISQPLGSVGIVSPWTHPITRALGPLATALAAGNRVMIKPSEFTPATAALMASTLREIFHDDEVTVVTGDAGASDAFAGLPFDRIFFPGGSDNPAPVAQGICGKSPAIVERGSSLRRAAQSIAFGKLANAGQTCIAPDYVMVAEEELDEFVSAFISAAARLYPDIATNADYATIISDQQYSRLRYMVEDGRAKGAHIWEVGAAGGRPELIRSRRFLPVVVTGVTEEMALSTEEIFGPILPVIPYRTLEEAIGYLNARPRPRVLCFFGSDGPALVQVLERTASDSVTINDTLLHFVRGNPTFGGMEASGTGACLGHDGFNAMSHAKGVFVQSDPDTTRSSRPPFGKLFSRAAGLQAGAGEER